MKKEKDTGEGLAMFLPYLVAPIAVALGFAFDVDFDKSGFLIVIVVGVCIFFGPLVFGIMIDSAFEKRGVNASATAVMLCALLVSVAISAIFMQFMPKNQHKAIENKEKQEYVSWNNSISADNTAAYYQDYYPLVWGYIKKNADSPYDYIEFYDSVWGDLQEYTGDGINFDTLTRYEQSLVNYPKIGSRVYFSSSTSRNYHSTNMCYSLLKSNPISRPASQRYSYNPCSKCVGD